MGQGLKSYTKEQLIEIIHSLSDTKKIPPRLAKAFQQVMEFHHKHGSYIGNTPQEPSEDTVDLRWELLEEEYKELVQALVDSDLAGIADGCADVLYVLIGLCVSYGIYLPDIWEAVHNKNMSKTGVKRADGKVMKQDGFKHANIKELLDTQKAIDTY